MMIQAAPTISAPSLSAALVRRRKPLMLAPPTVYAMMPIEPIEAANDAGWPTWREDLRFFAACYVAGVVFFLIMLS